MYENITIEEIVNILRRTQNWKSDGTDNDKLFGSITYTHQLMTKLISENILKPQKMPDWLTEFMT